MKLKVDQKSFNPYVAMLYDKVTMTISFDKSDKESVYELARQLEEVKGKDIDIEVKRHREKRSLDSNAYAWVLMGKIAKKLGISAEEVYKEQISYMNNYDIVPIKNEAVERFIRNWRQQGIGWLCEMIGASKHQGYTNLKCHYGSSVFDSKEMSDFIDRIIMDAKDLGIETATPDEVERMKNLWETK